MKEKIGPGFQGLGAHNFVYSLGNVSHWDLAAKLVTSPYVRRLQAIHYFSDLQHILQTTYEQHVQGTSCLVQFYVSSVAGIWANMEEKLLKASHKTHGKQASEDYVAVYREYESRVKKISPLPSLMGMIAAPPYRRPFGTYIKRDYMKLLAAILRHRYLQHLLSNKDSSNSDIDSIIENLYIIKNEIINIYEKILKSEKIRFLPCIERTLKLTASNTKNFSLKLDKLLNTYKKLLINNIKEKINNIFYIIDLIKEKINNINRSDLELIHLLPPAFLLRYRTLSTILGFAYIYYEILNNIYKRINKKLLIDLNKDLDVILQALDAMTVNFMATLLSVVELNNIKLNNKYRYYLSPLGAQEVMILLPLLAGHNSGVDQKKSIIISHVQDFLTLLKDNDIYSCVQFKRSCIFTKDNININDKYKNKYIILNKSLREDFPHDILIVPSWLWKPEIYRNIRTAYCCVLTARKESYDGCSLSWSEGLGILGEELATSFDPGVLGGLYVSKSRSPFLTYSMVSMIQSDMLPSAFQLDLLHRLTKDINMGLKISPLNIDDIVLNIDLYSVLVVDLLNAIYTHIFKDPAAIAKRVGLMIAGDAAHEECPCYRKIDVLAALYFLLLAREYSKYSNNIKDILEKIKIYKIKELNEIIDAADSLTSLLDSLSNLLKLLVKENLKLKASNSCQEQEPASACIEKLENAFNSFLGFSDIGARQYLQLSLPLRRQEGEDEQRLLYHGIITLQTLSTLLQDHEPAKKNPNYIARTLLILFQTTYSKGLEDAIKNEINKNLKKININAEVEKVMLLIPTQGIVKTYFHLPIEIPGGPIIVDAVKLKSSTAQNSPLQEMSKLELKIFDVDKTPKDYQELTETLPTTLQDPQTFILPDTTLWSLSGPREDHTDNRPLKIDDYNVTAEPKLVYKLNLIYSIILKTKIDNAPTEKQIRYIIIKSLINILKQLIYNKIK